MMKSILLLVSIVVIQGHRRNAKFEEVYSWKQITYDINGYSLLHDRFGNLDETIRSKRENDNIIFQQDEAKLHCDGEASNSQNDFTPNISTTTRPDPKDEVGQFFIQYNNVPMGVERYGDRLFVTMPRRRYGIPSTLNYIDMSQTRSESPHLKPYPDMAAARKLISVYRTRVDRCNRLWMVDTGMLEVPGARRQLQPPAIVVFDLNTNTQSFRYPFKDSDLPSENTAAGLASITINVGNDCSDTYAYIPDLATYGLIVFSLKDYDSWRLTNNYFSFNPLAGNLNIGGQSFQWNDGIFSITTSEADCSGCKTAYFHPLVSTQEFSISTCILNNKTAASDSSLWTNFQYLGDRGPNQQSTMHGFHRSGVIFYATVGDNALTCWNTRNKLNARNVGVLAKDSTRMMYPSDLHVTDDEVWWIANSMPNFIYSSLNRDEDNFFIYRGNVKDLISGTVCE